MFKRISVICLAGLFVSTLSASAATFTFATASGATAGGEAVSASATVTTNANGTVSVTLNDLLANPMDVGQLISDFDFTLSNGATSGTLTSSSGTTIFIGSGGTTTPGTTGSTGWGVNNNVNGGIQLDALGFVGPAGLIIGPGPYTNANSSIAGNGPHNPFILDTATFTLLVSGVTDTTSVTSATFSFGTTPGVNVPGVPGNPPPPIPEPASIALFGTGMAGLAAMLRRRFHMPTA